MARPCQIRGFQIAWPAIFSEALVGMRSINFFLSLVDRRREVVPSIKANPRRLALHCAPVVEKMEELIDEVKEHPCLYDIRMEEYRDVQRKYNIWEQIAQNLQRDYWKKLRDCYRQAQARRKTTSGQAAKNWKPWRYEKQMQFLTASMRSRETNTNIEDINIDCVDDNNESTVTTACDMQEEIAGSVSTSKDGDTRCRKKRKSSTPSDVDKVITYLHEKRAMSYKQDDLDYFFISACHSTRKLSRRLQNQIKREVLDCIARAEEQHEYEISKHVFAPSPAPSTFSAATASTDSDSSFASSSKCDA
ncbi:Transcription factor Adf-1-like 4 [Homarus americanus]|uniref:Transcription factor Adf-1-like 4 n=1 Tax=Homarus americanus TaxID=6706 RepID=A0A8J5MZ43_HOMAM|nr:Transcription factor Adf-1-like 4 [Homarus americanus]